MDNPNNKKIGMGGWFIAVLLILAVGGGIALISKSSKSQGPTVADVARNPESYYGQQLSLKGEIENMKSPRIFTLDQERRVSGDEILVLSIPAVEPQGGSSGDSDSLNNQDVQVSGTVRPFVSAEISRETGIDLDPQMVIDFENRPVIIAREVQLLPEH